jgi:hypothetical protein
MTSRPRPISRDDRASLVVRRARVGCTSPLRSVSLCRQGSQPSRHAARVSSRRPAKREPIVLGHASRSRSNNDRQNWRSRLQRDLLRWITVGRAAASDDPNTCCQRANLSRNSRSGVRSGVRNLRKTKQKGRRGYPGGPSCDARAPTATDPRGDRGRRAAWRCTSNRGWWRASSS